VNNSAIQRVTDAIRARLNEALGNAPDSDLVFIGPLHDTGADDAFMVLFLYRVVPNPDLRNSRHVAPANNPADPPVTYENAMPLDLYYILTAGGREDGGERDSLLRLGQAISNRGRTHNRPGENNSHQIEARGPRPANHRVSLRCPSLSALVADTDPSSHARVFCADFA
jgi:hypothetical protein